MTTTLGRYTEAYASMVVAVLRAAHPPVALRVYGQDHRLRGSRPRLGQGAAAAGAARLTRSRSAAVATAATDATVARRPEGHPGGPVLLGSDLALDPALVERADLPGLPYAERIGADVFPFGVLRAAGHGHDLTIVDELGGRTPTGGAGIVLAPELVDRRDGRELLDRLPEIEATLAEVLAKISKVPPSEARKMMLDFSKEHFGVKDHDVLFTPAPEVTLELLSPIGIAHFYRQLYFNLDEGVGPIEEAFTIAPLETFEVVYETVRRQVQEEVIETGLEETSESELESHNLEEVSDKVSSMLQRDLAAGIQTKASYSTPVFQVGVSASLDLSSSNKRSTEETARRLKETTKRASERITKTFSLRTRSVTEFSATTTTRRTIENTSEHPVSYGLRRVLRRVRVKVQDLGPRLVWQYYLRDPGAGLGLSRFVQLAGSQPVSVPDVPPGLPPRPTSGSDSGTAVCAVATTTTVTTNEQNPEPGQYGNGTIRLRVPAGKGRMVTSVTIDSIADVGIRTRIRTGASRPR